MPRNVGVRDREVRSRVKRRIGEISFDILECFVDSELTRYSAIEGAFFISCSWMELSI